MNASDLQPFCSTDESRPQLLIPFSRGAYTYATDARILVRVSRIEDVGEEGGLDLEAINAAASIEGREPFYTEDLTQWQEVPEIRGRAFPACCSECAEGPRYEIKLNCPECKGTGVVEGFAPDQHEMRVGNRLAAWHYLKKIKALPNAEVSTEIGTKLAPIIFRFTGGVGLLMPLREH